MRRFGVLGAIVFGLLVVAQPAAAVTPVIQGSGRFIDARLWIDATTHRTFHFVIHVQNNTHRSCSTRLRIRGTDVDDARHLAPTDHQVYDWAVTFRPGYHSFRWQSDRCDWQMTVRRT
jgi:opacity protein-like surface antigen